MASKIIQEFVNILLVCKHYFEYLSINICSFFLGESFKLWDKTVCMFVMRVSVIVKAYVQVYVCAIYIPLLAPY